MCVVCVCVFLYIDAPAMTKSACASRNVCGKSCNRRADQRAAKKKAVVSKRCRTYIPIC